MRIALVDMREVYQQYKKSADMTQEVRQAMQAGNARIEQMVGQGRELEKPLRDGTIDKETPEFDEREKKVLQLSNNVTTFKAVKQRELKPSSEAKAMLEQSIKTSPKRCGNSPSRTATRSFWGSTVKRRPQKATRPCNRR